MAVRLPLVGRTHTAGARSPARPPARRNGGLPSYRRLAVCLSPGADGEAVALACDLAADHGSQVTAIAAIEVPQDAPLESPDPDVENAAREAVRAAQAIADLHNVDAVGAVLHTRNPGQAIVDEITARDIQLVVLTDRAAHNGGRLGPATRYVLKHSPCRVMLVRRGGPTPPRPDGAALDTVFRSRRPADEWPTGEFVEPGEAETGLHDR